MEQFKMADVVQIKKTRTRAGRIVSWSEFEPLLSQLRQKLDCTQDEAMKFLGYAGGSHLDAWCKLDEVPILAINAIKWMLHESGETPKKEKVMQFEHEELVLLFGTFIGWAMLEGDRRRLMAKIAKELAC